MIYRKKPHRETASAFYGLTGDKRGIWGLF